MRDFKALLLLVSLALGLTACRESSSSAAVGAPTSGSVVPGVSTAPVSPYGSATNQAQWQTALSALALDSSHDQVSFEPPSVAAFNRLITVAWPGLEPVAREALEVQLKAVFAGLPAGALSVSLKSMSLDLKAPPQLSELGQPPLQVLELSCPGGAQSWRVNLDLEVTGQVSVNVFGAPLTVSIPMPVSAEVSRLQIGLPVLMDLSQPEAPSIVTVAPPSVDFILTLGSSNPLIGQLTSALNQLLDPVLRVALPIAALVAQRELGVLATQLPNSAQWGKGGPAPQAFLGAPPLEPIAAAVSDEIQRNHIPHNNVFPAIFDQPDVGGKVIGYRHFGDSALWTGGYLVSEAYRYDLTGDPRALSGARVATEGLGLLSRVVGAPYEGLLSRAALPVSSPYHGSLAVKHAPIYFTGVVNGVTYGAAGQTSRDSYCGTFAGLGQAYHRVPQLRGEVTDVVDRLVGYLDDHGWMVYQAAQQPNNPTGQGMSVSFVTAPQAVLAIATVAKRVNPARWSALHASYADLADILWFSVWASSQEVHHIEYFGFNLGHIELMSLLEFETDPARYRSYLQVLRVLHETVGEHQNAWFDAVRALGFPGERAALGPRVRAELELWTQRPRRGFTVQNSLDPSIATTTYTLPVANVTGTLVAPSSAPAQPTTVAVYPVPIPKRPSRAFLWSGRPFKLDGAVDPYEQHPGIDLLLPYWLTRSHNILP